MTVFEAGKLRRVDVLECGVINKEPTVACVGLDPTLNVSEELDETTDRHRERPIHGYEQQEERALVGPRAEEQARLVC